VRGGGSVELDGRSERVAFEESPELAEIAQLEYARDLGGGRLQALLASGEPGIRRRAALALGRFPYPDFGAEVTEALVRALEDDDPYVRRSAAFGLGQRGDQVAGGVLAAYRNDPDPELRMRVAEASRRLTDPALRSGVLLALRDDRLEVRIAAVLAMSMWSTDDPRASEADRVLLDLLLPPGQQGVEIDAELRWRTLYSLERRKAKLGRNAFLVYSRSDLALERLFAVRGLAAIEPDAETLAALENASGDADWRVAVEAVVGLGRHAAAPTLPAVLKAAESPSPHVRRTAYEALGSFKDVERVLPRLTRATRDVSSSAQAAALVSIAKVLPSKDAREHLVEHAKDQDPVVRAGVAQGAQYLASEEAVPLLTTMAKDPDRAVAGAAIEGLGRHLSDGVREELHDLLRSSDNGLKLASILALREGPDPTDVGPLVEAIAAAKGDIAPEVTFNALLNLGAVGGPEAGAAVEAALHHPEPYVRQVAHQVLQERFQRTAAASPPEDAAPAPQVPLPGRDFPRYERNPLVEIQTTRGTMVFELFPVEAPVHVHNFLSLAAAGHYNGLVFHRVVPDFVVQGGDYRGDGNGNRSWNGRALPAEFTARSYVRGSLGMPRNEDPDSGGSQFFVTHRPTPHLDGRYTLFGELRSGGDVLDRLEVGDRILSVRAR
jgi:peptidylprolyl isomerase